MTIRDHTIPVTQYLRPDGRRQAVNAPVTADYAAKANAFINKGGVYEAEVLTTGDVSITAAFKVDGEIQDIAIEICPNNETIHATFEKVIDSSQRFV